MANYPKCPSCGATGPEGSSNPCCACVPVRSIRTRQRWDHDAGRFVNIPLDPPAPDYRQERLA